MLGEDVTVITPYYNVNRKGEAGYLGKDPAGFVYYKNVSIKVGAAEYIIGVHKGTVNKVKLVFLHNVDLFPVVYSEGGAANILRQICGFDKVFPLANIL